MSEVNSMLEIKPGPDEEWKYIDSYGDWYEISNYGRIRTWRSNKLGQRRKNPRYLSGFKTPQGYIRVMLNKDNHGVHRLVLKTFHGPPESEDLVTCHNDGSKTNNHISNLRWGTNWENSQDMILHGRSPTGEKNYFATLSENKVLEIVERYQAGVPIRVICYYHKLPFTTVHQIVRGEVWSSVTGITPK